MFFSSLEWCIPEGCSPICPPQQGEKLPMPEELTRKFLDKILDYMTQPVSIIIVICNLFYLELNNCNEMSQNPTFILIF